MSKSDKEHTAAPPPAPKAAPAVAATVCSVCGQGDNLTGSAGAARWHQFCADARPDIIAKVKARA